MLFSEEELEKYADVLLWGMTTARTRPFKKRDIVAISYHHPALELAEVLYRKVLEMGMHPVHRMVSTPVMEEAFYMLGNSAQVSFIPPGEKVLFENLNGHIFLHAPSSITHLKKADPEKIGKAAVARKALRDILVKREEKGLFGWTLCSLVTKELARHAGMSQKKYAQKIAKACYLDEADPVAKWKEVHQQAAELKKWLNGLKVDYFHVESKNIDLIIRCGAKRRWIGISGHNIPSFELFISPDWRGTRGFFYADQPSFRSGNYVRGVRLEFKRGVAVDIKAQKGELFVKKQLSMDKGAARIGEFSLTDRRFSRIDAFMANTLFDENFGGPYGNCHIAMGSSYSDTFSGNPAELTRVTKAKLGFNDSALHWDLVNTENKRVTAILASGGKKLIYENGEFDY